MSSFEEVIEAFQELTEDSDAPRNLREKVRNMVSYVKSSDESDDLKANKLLQELEEMSSDINIPTYIRTQLWGISSILEQIQ